MSIKLKTLLTEASHPVGSLGKDMNTTPNPNISRAEYEADVKLWASKFRQGQILKIEQSRVDRSLQTITYWDALKNEWVVKAPPISGYKDNGGMFPISSFGGSYGWTRMFDQNTTPLSKGAAESKAKSMAAETTLTAKEAVKMLGTLSLNQQVKITIVK